MDIVDLNKVPLKLDNTDPNNVRIVVDTGSTVVTEIAELVTQVAEALAPN